MTENHRTKGLSKDTLEILHDLLGSKDGFSRRGGASAASSRTSTTGGEGGVHKALVLG